MTPTDANLHPTASLDVLRRLGKTRGRQLPEDEPIVYCSPIDSGEKTILYVNKKAQELLHFAPGDRVYIGLLRDGKSAVVKDSGGNKLLPIRSSTKLSTMFSLKCAQMTRATILDGIAFFPPNTFLEDSE